MDYFVISALISLPLSMWTLYLDATFITNMELWLKIWANSQCLFPSDCFSLWKLEGFYCSLKEILTIQEIRGIQEISELNRESFFNLWESAKTFEFYFYFDFFIFCTFWKEKQFMFHYIKMNLKMKGWF